MKNLFCLVLLVGCSIESSTSDDNHKSIEVSVAEDKFCFDKENSTHTPENLDIERYSEEVNKSNSQAKKFKKLHKKKNNINHVPDVQYLSVPLFLYYSRLILSNVFLTNKNKMKQSSVKLKNKQFDLEDIKDTFMYEQNTLLTKSVKPLGSNRFTFNQVGEIQTQKDA